MMLHNDVSIKLETMYWGVRVRFSVVNKADFIDVSFNEEEISFFHSGDFDVEQLKNMLHDLINEADWIIDDESR